MYYTVYKITNKINEKIYIGVHKTNDLDDGYMGSGKQLKNAQNKYGIENFEKEILEVFNNSEDMFQMESILVNEEFVKRNDTYNLKAGGFGGWDYINNNPNIIKGFDLINKNGLNNSAGQCYEAARKIKNEEGYREWFSKKVSDGLKEYLKYNERKGSFTGKKHSEETKIKIGEANSKHQKGEGNSQFGTVWIHSLKEKVSKKIKKDEFPEYEALGWLKGRKMKF